MQKYYKILGVKYDASLGELKQAYRDLVKIWHPDRFARDERVRRKAEVKMLEINEAYHVLQSISVEASSSLEKVENLEGPGFGRPRDNSEIATKPLTRRRKSRTAVRGRKNLPIWLYAVVATMGTASLLAATLFSDIFSGIGNGSIHTGKTLSPPIQRVSYTPSQFFDVGSTKEVVFYVQGEPSRHSDREWHYGSSVVYFKDNRVERWYASPTDPLRVHQSGFDPELTPLFGVGSTNDEVIAIQGSPDELNDEVWRYGFSLIYFEHGRVSRWYESPRDPLNVKGLSTKTLRTNRQIFAKGSTQDEVIAAQGTPEQFTDRVWRFGSSLVYFEKGRVARWYESLESPLSVRRDSSSITSSQKIHFSIGSSPEEVLLAEGTPDEFTEQVWRYGQSLVHLQQNRVSKVFNSPSSPLKGLSPDSGEQSIARKGFITIGATKEEVLAVQGLPTEFSQSTWFYGYSKVHFNNDRVVNWFDSPTHPLRLNSLQSMNRSPEVR